MNAYLELAKCLEWNGSPYLWICDNYNDYLLSKLKHYLAIDSEASNELNVLCDQMSILELKSFVAIPFVAELLHPKSIFKTIDDLWNIQSFALSYLVWLEKVPMKYDLNNLPTDGLRKPNVSIPFTNRVSTPLPVSATCDIKLPGMDRGGNDLIKYSLEDSDIETLRIIEAEWIIKKYNLNTWNFVSAGTEILVIRKEISEANRFSSASFRGLSGLNLLINSNKVSIDFVVDALIHESIHSLLYQLEPIHGDFFSIKKNAKNSVISPWTNNTINIDNLAQACFVWFGLYNFWMIVNQNSYVSEYSNFADVSIRRIRKGFDNLQLDYFKNCLNKDMLSSIDYMKVRLSS